MSIVHLEAQVSVFDCGISTQYLTQTELDAEMNIFGSCFNINTSLSNGNDIKSIFASDKIKLEEGAHLGGDSNPGKMHLSLSKPSDLDVVVINYDKLNAVKRYKKLEFGVPLSIGLKDSISNFIKSQGSDNEQLNPFVDWDIDVKATFYHPASGWYEKINGFYTRDYIEVGDTGVVLEGNDTIIDDWLDVDSIPGLAVGNLYPFRIRYAPPKNGKWICQVKIKVKGNLAYKSHNFQFNVKESGDLGYVHVHENKCNLKRGNRMIFPVGHNATTEHNLGWGGGGSTDYPGVNHYSSTNSEKAANTLVWEEYLQNISDYLQKGGKYLRTIEAPWFSLIEFEERGNYFKRLHYASETDKLLDTLEKYDALVCFNLMMHTPIMKYGDYDMNMWDWGKYEWDGEQWHDSMSWNNNYDIPYCYNDKPFGEKEPYEMFTDPEDLSYHKQRIRYYNARYGYSTKIYEFEILSEPFHLNEMAASVYSSLILSRPFGEPSDPDYTKVRNAVYNYHKVISGYMKDSLRVNQLVGIDMGSGIDFDYKSPQLSTIDVVGFNFYYSAPNSLYINDGNNVYKSYVKRIWGINGFIPVLISEGGLTQKYQECSNFSQFAVDAMTLPFCGLAGYNQWIGWDEDQGDLRDITIRAQDHMNGVDVINTLSQGGGNWHHGKQQTFLKFSGQRRPNLLEEQNYISNDKTKFVGYVRNRTYNARTKGCYGLTFTGLGTNAPYFYLNIGILWNQPPLFRRIKINGLQNGEHYTIHWFSFKYGNYIKTDCLKANNGNIVLEYPWLTSTPYETTDNPVMWFVGKKSNCNRKRSLLVDDSTSILDNHLNKARQNTIYPNPFEDFFLVKSLQDDIFILQAIDGSIIGEYKITKGDTRVSCNLAKGIYIGTLQNQTQTFKIIKQ